MKIIPVCIEKVYYLIKKLQTMDFTKEKLNTLKGTSKI